MLLISVLAVLAAAPVQIAAPGFSVHGFDGKAGSFYSDQVSQQLAFHGLKVISRTEVEALLGNERQKQLLGCSESSSSCIAELAGALGSDGVLMGDVAKVGDKFRLSVRIISARNGERLSSAVATGSSEDSVLEAISSVAQRMASETMARVRGDSVPTGAASVTTQHVGVRRFFWAPLALGGAGLALGTVSIVQAKSRLDQLRSGQTLTEPLPSQLRNEGQTWQMLSAVGFGVGAAAIAAGIALLIFGSDSVVESGIAFIPGPTSMGIAGRF